MKVLWRRRELEGATQELAGGREGCTFLTPSPIHRARSSLKLGRGQLCASSCRWCTIHLVLRTLGEAREGVAIVPSSRPSPTPFLDSSRLSLLVPSPNPLSVFDLISYYSTLRRGITYRGSRRIAAEPLGERRRSGWRYPSVLVPAVASHGDPSAGSQSASRLCAAVGSNDTSARSSQAQLVQVRSKSANEREAKDATGMME
jgi:hypothetical protein